MRLLAISDHPRQADSLRAVVHQASFEVTHALSVEAALETCAPALAKAVIVHADVADARLAEKVSRLCNAGYSPVYAALTSRSDIWEEKVLLAGAEFVFHLPWRGNLLLSRLGRIDVRNAPTGAPPPLDMTVRGSISPFGAPEPIPSGSNPLLARLHGVAHLFRHASKPEMFAEAYLDQIREALALNRVALYMAPDGSGKALECLYAAGIEPKRWKMASLSLETGLGRWMAEHLVAVSLGTMERYGLEPGIRAEMEGLGAQCAIPVQGGDEFMGVLLVGSRVTGYSLTNEDIELVYLLALELGRTLKTGRLNKALAKERQFLADLTEGLGSGCAVFDKDFQVLHVNRQMVQVCGGGPTHEFSLRSLPKILASLSFEVSAGTRREAESVFVDASGRTHLAKVSLLNSQSRSVLLLVDDISRLTATHAGELLSLERELVARLGAQFVHEVRNSLTRLMTLGQLLPSNRSDPGFLDQLQSVLPRDLNRVLRHAALLEILSKPTPEERARVDLRDAITAAWREVSTEYRNVSPEWLDVSSVPEGVNVHVNAEVFSRACFELLLNGAQSIEDAKERRLLVSAEEAAGSTCRVTFEDSGKGFQADIVASAVSPFVTTRNQGLGLGLTLVEKFVRETGGTLALSESKKLGGARVRLVLPCDG